MTSFTQAFAMPVFKAGGAVAATGGGGSGSGSGNGCPLMPLKDVAACLREPVNSICTIGRVSYVYALSDRYPNVKFVLSGEGEQETGIVKVLVKGAGKPPKMPEIDQLMRLDGVEVRKIHRKASGDIPEGAVHPDLAIFELSANFGSGAGGQRKRGNQ